MKPTKVISLLIIISIGISLGVQIINGFPPLPEVNEGEQLKLDGLWAFYPNQFLTPKRVSSEENNPEYINVPGYWNKDVLYATYEYNIDIPKTWVNEIKSIYIPKVYTANSVWIDGRLVGKVGTIGKSHEKSSPLVIPQNYTFIPRDNQLQIIIHVSNHHYRKSGIAGTIVLGDQEEVLKKHKLKVYLDWFSIGALISMSLFLFNLYLLHRKDKSALVFGLFCLLYGIRVFIKGDSYLYQLIPGFNWELAVRMDYIILFGTLIFFIKYIELTFETKVSNNFYNITKIISLLFIFVIVLTDPNIFSYTIYVIEGAAFLVLSYFVFILYKGYKRKQKGAFLLIVVSVIFGLSAINDILYTEQVINTTPLISLGLVVFCTGHSYLLSNKISNAYREIESLSNELDTNQKEVIYTLGEITETRSKETGNHVRRVALYSNKLALLMGLGERESYLIKIASPLHDIGKVAIPDSILNKPGKLTEEEFEIMKKHTTIGYQMLMHSSREVMKIGAQIAHTHHERFDGTGYPNQLKGTDIPLVGRITAVADVFDALSNDRVYKKAWKIEDIIDYFNKQRNKHFDSEIVDLLLSNLNQFIEINNTHRDN